MTNVLTPQQLVHAVKECVPGTACNAMITHATNSSRSVVWLWDELIRDVLEERPNAYDKLLAAYTVYLKHRILRG